MVKEGVAFCTIITADYIPFALALRESILAFSDEVSFHILIADEKTSLKAKIENEYPNTTISYPEEVCCNKIGKEIYSKYYEQQISVFRWSMKPIFVSYLLKNNKYEKVIYCDADIYFFNNYDFLLNLLNEDDLLLTPHWRSSDPIIDYPNFEILYTSGLYNGGFLASNQGGIKALEWLASASLTICIKDPSKGQFFDQTHFNLLPIYFEKVRVIKHRGCNVACWNMIECVRTISDENEQVLIANKYPVIFIHFTQSTMNGIVSGVDKLLMPHLKEYVYSVNQYCKEFGLAPINIVEIKQEISGIEKDIKIEKIRFPNEILNYKPDGFLDIPFTNENLDRYYIRKSILNAVIHYMPSFGTELLDIGCGKMPYKEFILQNSSVKKYTGLDIQNAIEYDLKIKPDFTWDGITMPFADDSFDSAFATEVLEHCPEPKIILNETYRVMKKGGCFFFTVPFLWNLHEVPHDEYRYTPFSLERILKECGFKKIEIKATGGWHASLAQMLGLWVRRASISPRKRKWLSFLLKPVIKRMIAKDKLMEVDFQDGEMITGLYGIAYK